MNKIWTFAWKEFLLNLRSVRFLVGFLLCLVIVPFTMIVSVNAYKIRMDSYRVEMSQSRERMESHLVWSSVRPLVVRQPEALSLFSRGISDNMGYMINIFVDTVPVFPYRTTWILNNPFMKVFPVLDFAGVLGIMLSLLALVFSYDAVTREREEGTLRFIFSSSGNRVMFLLGKWLGVILTVLPMVVFCYVMALGFVCWGAGVTLSAGEWAGIGWMFLSSFVYLSLFVWMGIFISAMHVHSVNSVVMCMLCWLCFLFVIPSLTSYLSRNQASATAYELVRDQKKKSESIYWKEYDRAYDSIRVSLGIDKIEPFFHKGGLDGSLDIRGGSRQALEHARQLAVRNHELRIEHAERCWKEDSTYLRELYRQRQWQDGLGFLSPSSTFSRLMSGLCCTDVSAFQVYMDEVRGYRKRFISFLSENGYVSSFAYITPTPQNEFMEDAEWMEFIAKKKQLFHDDPAAYESFSKEAERKYSDQQYKPLDTSGLPRFIPEQISGWRRLTGEFHLLLCLCLVSLGLMGGAIYVFGKYDLR